MAASPFSCLSYLRDLVSCISRLFVAFAICISSVCAAKPPLARLSFWLPPERMAEFEVAYREKVVPILKRHGLVESPERGRATADSVFARLFELKSISDFVDRRQALTGDTAWQAALQNLGMVFGSPRTDGHIRSSFVCYVVPSGPGRAVPSGPGWGHWCTFDVTDGLAGGDVRSILQDRKGRLWFATRRGGVSRYDGTVFVNLTEEDGLLNNWVDVIFEDREGNLWFGTAGGASRYDGETFTSFTEKEGLANGVRSVIQDYEGNLWFATYSAGVIRYDGEVFNSFTTENGLPDNRVRSALQDRDGNLWFGTPGGASRYDGRTFTNFTTEDGLAHDSVWSMFQDRDGNLWFGTYRGGVSRFDGEGFITFTQNDGLGSNAVFSIFQDREGNVWFGTGGGVSRYAGRTFATFTEADGLVNNAVRSIFQDREGHLWFGTAGGASRYAGRTFITFSEADGLVRSWVSTSLEDREGHLWFGTLGHGVIRYDREGRRSGEPSGQGTLTTFTIEDGLVNNWIYSMLEDRAGNLWFGTGYGVSRYDGETFITLDETDGLVDRGVDSYLRVHSIFEDRAGNLWFGTGRYGVSRYDGRTFTTFTEADGLPGSGVWTIAQDRGGHLWFGSGHNVSRYDGRTFTTFFREADGLPDSQVRSIVEDREGNLWFGTASSVIRYDGKAFTTFTTKDGLANNWVSAMLEDRGGHLWFGTDGGVSRYNGNVFQTLTQRDGLAGNQVHSILQDREGAIWFSTNRGVTRYLSPVSQPPPVSIDAVVAGRRYEKVTELSVPSSVGLTAFEFHAMSFRTRPEAMVYRYRLTGYDDGWRATHRRRVEYEDLSRGDYTFEVQAVDRDLVYSEAPAAVSLRVRFPYVQGVWISVLGISAVLIAYQAVRIFVRDRRLYAANAALSEANEALSREIAERSRLDAQIRDLRYLYRLRTALGSARSPGEVIRSAGETLMEVLSAGDSGGVVIRYDGSVRRFGEPEKEGQVPYVRPLVQGNRERGEMALFCGVALTESQERALLDETAGQICRVLEAREMEVQLLQSARLVSLGEMAAGVAHELNQPLSVISTTAGDIYQRHLEGIELPPERMVRMMQNILEVVERMDETIDHMRIFSRDTSRDAPVRFSVNGVIRSSLKLIRAQLENHGIALELDLAEGLPPVSGRPHQVEQVFLNLLSNARDALDERVEEIPGGAGADGAFEKRISIRTRAANGGGEWAVAEVADNGIGMDAADLERIFDPFFTTKDERRGTGLGLSISYAIVQNHSGRMVCESRKGAGALFRVMLPALKR